MKQFYQITLVIVLAITTSFANANLLFENDSVSMGAGYANDIYYSFENGEISSVDRSNWDIGFYSNMISAGIITNGAAGVELYAYENGDTTDWNSIDTTGLSNWPILYNSADEWENGAFNRNELGHPDYGWGIYNIIHVVVGDSLFMIKTVEGSIKKLWIEKKVAVENTYYFKYADLNGENQVSVVLECGEYTDKNFVYYSIETGEVLDREPNSDTWDILFTKYMGINNDLPYPVTGALNNIDVPANSFYPVTEDYMDWYAAPMDSTKSPVGYEWKYFDMDMFSYVIEDSMVYFVQNKNEDVYKLVFTGFEGMSSGKIIFEKSLNSPSGTSAINYQNEFRIYPNPASEFVKVDLTGEIQWDMISISDLRGKIIFSQEVGLKELITIPTDKLNSGVYLVTIKSAQNIAVQKLIIQ